MNTELLFESFSYIDEELLARSEKKCPNVRVFAGVAACAAAVLIGAGLFLRNETLVQNQVISCYPADQWTIFYNQVEDMPATDMARSYNYFMLYGEPLSAEHLNALAPNLGDLSLSYSGNSTFGPTGLEWVDLEISDPNLPPVQVQLSEKELPSRCFSKCAIEGSVVGGENGVGVIAYEHRYQESLFLELSFWLNDKALVRLSTEGELSQEDALKERLSDIVACYVVEKRDLDLGIVTTNGVPVIRHEDLSFADAQKDAEFGKYFLKNLPNGFAAESIRRVERPDYNYLRGLWTRNYDQLEWEVSYFDEADKARLTSVKDTENYDLALYPIPRADSVPEDLREVVDNPIFRIEELTLEVVQKRSYRVDDAGDTSGERMRFSVLYGDVLVEVSSKGISSRWVYDQLISIK